MAAPERQTGLRRILAALRTLIWAPVFFIGSALIVVATGLALPFSERAFFAIVASWGTWQRWTSRWILGQHVVVEGVLPTGGAFVVIKHEAMFEAVDVQVLFRRPVVFAKAELFDIPLWGRLARDYGLIAIERAAGASALRAMREAARGASGQGRPLILFPEGTRVAVGDAPSIRAGFAGLYKLLAMPVVPIAVQSGHVAPRDGWIRLPGVIRYRVGEVIPIGLPRDEAEARVHAALNALNGPDCPRN